MKKQLLLSLCILSLCLSLRAQSPTISPAPGYVTWCPDHMYSYQVLTSGAQQTNCTYKWTVTNGVIPDGIDNQQSVWVKWDNTTSKGTLAIKLTNCSEATNTTYTAEYIIRSVNDQTLSNLRTLQSLPYCSTSSVNVLVDQMTIPNTGGTSPVSLQYVDGYEWSAPGWKINGSTGVVRTGGPSATLEPINGCSGGSVSVKAYVNSCDATYRYSNSASVSLARVGTFSVTPQGGYAGASCGNATPVTFSLNYNFNNQSYPLSCASNYVWNFPSGWHGPNGELSPMQTTSNSITLTPSGNSSDQGNITVSNINMDCGTVAVNRSYAISYTAPNPYITGPSAICAGGGTLTLNNVPIGAAVTWQATPSSLFAVSSGSFTGNGGNQNISLALTSGIGTTGVIDFAINSCDGLIQKSTTVWLGTPDAPAPNTILRSSDEQPAEYSQVCTNTLGNTFYIVQPSYVSSYTWSLSPSTASYFSAANNYVDMALVYPGTYQLFVTAYNGCGAGNTGIITIYGVDCGGNGGLGFSAVYPNPATEYLTVELTDSLSLGDSEELGQQYRLMLMNKSGRKIYSIQSSKKENQIPLEGIPNGIYYLNLHYKNEVLRKQIVINK